MLAENAPSVAGCPAAKPKTVEPISATVITPAATLTPLTMCWPKKSRLKSGGRHRATSGSRFGGALQRIYGVSGGGVQAGAARLGEGAEFIDHFGRPVEAQVRRGPIRPPPSQAWLRRNRRSGWPCERACRSCPSSPGYSSARPELRLEAQRFVGAGDGDYRQSEVARPLERERGRSGERHQRVRPEDCRLHGHFERAPAGDDEEPALGRDAGAPQRSDRLVERIVPPDVLSNQGNPSVRAHQAAA